MILKGLSANKGIVKSRAFVVNSLDFNDKDMNEGDILVINFFLPHYFSLFLKASAVITELGGITCHAASLTRELGIPCIVSVENVTALIKTGMEISIDGEKGEVEYVPID